jgi:hypothetical protein
VELFCVGFPDPDSGWRYIVGIKDLGERSHDEAVLLHSMEVQLSAPTVVEESRQSLSSLSTEAGEISFQFSGSQAAINDQEFRLAGCSNAFSVLLTIAQGHGIDLYEWMHQEAIERFRNAVGKELQNIVELGCATDEQRYIEIRPPHLKKYGIDIKSRISFSVDERVLDLYADEEVDDFLVKVTLHNPTWHQGPRKRRRAIPDYGTPANHSSDNMVLINL